MKTINYTITTITATNNIAVAMFANKKYIYKTASSNKIALLETFKAILNKAKTNDELMEKPVLIITTQSILKGFTTGGYIEYLRTGADQSGNKFTDEEMALIRECADLLARKSFNVRLVDEKMISPKDQVATQIKRDAFTTVQQLSRPKAVQNTKAQASAMTDTKAMQTYYQSEIMKAVAEGDITKASQLQALMLQLTNPAPQAPVEETNEYEVPEDIKEEMDQALGLEDVTTDSDSMDI